ncbi:unnamed protein product [Spirodela intermedia]|uniref:Uncharacterized protein n=1 Tax=Spirodela intermedia TaxID=51605 RepID=A0A7I8JF39_SPIIN|nr:unnamed protein product [Spirodela intermedia]CAA6668365.1 unnamed protein product [Spirodela intermedia]
MWGCCFSSWLISFLGNSTVRRRRYARFSAAAADCQNENWISGNSLYKRHPHLQRLEACDNSPWQLFPVLTYIIVSGLFQNPFVASRVLHICCNGDPPDLNFATVVFRQIRRPNLFSWNTIIKGFAESEDRRSIAFSFYRQMLDRGILPDKHTFPFLLTGCRPPSTAKSGKFLHAHCVVLGFSMDTFVQTALVNMYLGCGHKTDARHLFDKMTSRDIVSWTCLISGLIAGGHHEEALEVFKALRSDEGQSAVKPTVATMVSAMAASAFLGALDHTRALHGNLEKTGYMADTFIGNSLINGYAKCGSIGSSSKIFQQMKDRDLLSWTAIISGFAANGMAQEALGAFAGMRAAGIVPDPVAFLAVLSACSHAGLVDEGVENFELMQRSYKLSPGLKHYGCMVDLFARAGLLRRACDACRAKGELELAEAVAGVIVSSGESAGGAGVLLSNMYADESRWQEASLVRKKVTGGGLRKPPGHSWIEVEGVVYRFMVENGSDPHLKEIISALDAFAKDGRS